MGYKHYYATTLDELLGVLIELSEEGHDMSVRWNGFDDHNLYSHPHSEQWIAIHSEREEANT